MILKTRVFKNREKNISLQTKEEEKCCIFKEEN